MLLFGDHSFNDVKNTSALTDSTEYIISAKRLDVPLYQNWHLSICLCAVYFYQEIALSFMLFNFIFSILK